MSCNSCVTNRDMQNRDTPNLPFAQELITYQGTTNPDRPDLPFAQSNSNRSRGVYIIYWKDGQESEMTLTSSIADYYRNLGHRVVLKSTPNPVLPTSTNGLTSDQVLQIVKSEFDDDIKLLHGNVIGLGDAMTRAKAHRDSIEAKINNISQQTGLNKNQVLDIIETQYKYDNQTIPYHLNLIHGNLTGLGDAMTRAKEHRDSVEAKVEENRLKFDAIHTKLQSLGDSQTRAKEHRDSIEGKLSTHGHGGNGCDCAWYDFACQAECAGGNIIERFLPYILIGGVALYAIGSRRKRR